MASIQIVCMDGSSGPGHTIIGDPTDCLVTPRSTASEILQALEIWDFPKDAYPKNHLKIGVNFMLQKKGHPNIQALLLRQAFLVKGPGMEHSFFCFWHSNDFPLGDVDTPVTVPALSPVIVPGHTKALPIKNNPWKGFNHYSATLAFAHAKLLAGWESEAMELPWDGSSHPSASSCKSSSASEILQTQLPLHQIHQMQCSAQRMPHQQSSSALPPADQFSSCRIKFSQSPDPPDPDRSQSQVPDSANTMDKKLCESQYHLAALSCHKLEPDALHVMHLGIVGMGKGIKESSTWTSVNGGKGHVYGGASHGDQGQSGGSRPSEHADEWEHVKPNAMTDVFIDEELARIEPAAESGTIEFIDVDEEPDGELDLIVASDAPSIEEEADHSSIGTYEDPELAGPTSDWNIIAKH